MSRATHDFQCPNCHNQGKVPDDVVVCPECHISMEAQPLTGEAIEFLIAKIRQNRENTELSENPPLKEIRN